MAGGPPQPFPARSGLWPRGPQRLSLRARLLWTFLVPLGVVLVLVGVVATTVLRHQLVHEVDARLKGAVSRTYNAADGYSAPAQDTDHDHDDGPSFLGARGQGAGTLGARIVHGETRQAGVVTENGSDEDLTDEQRDELTELPPDGDPRTVDLGGDLGHYRLVARTAPDGDVLVTGLPLEGTNTAITKLITMEVLAGLAGLLVTAVAGALVIRRTLRPLSHVAATATRVTELPLASGEVTLPERVPAEDTQSGDEVGRVGTALNQLLDHVEDSLAARQASEMQVRQFVADASHELRTPLASIRGYAEFFRRQQRDGREPTPEDVAHTLRRVESEALRMSSLVDELLLLARLDAGRDLELGEVDLAALVVDATSDAHVASPGHRWRVDVPPAAVLVHGDAARLHQVLANLLGNVRTHTPEGTTATVGLHVEGGGAVLTVTDDGPGIPPALQAHVFERFARGDASRSRSAGSTGLGLAIVEAVIAAHDGTVSLDSRPGQTRFTVRLPGATLGEPMPDDDADHELPAPVRTVIGG
jgi:two-component system OmpR family sensor kinase